MHTRRQLLRAVPLAVVGLSGCLGETDTAADTATDRPRNSTSTAASSSASTSPPQPTSTTRTPTDRTATSTPTATPTETPTATPVATATVRIDGGSFEPRRLSVDPRTVVRWVNDDPDSHRVESMRVDGSASWTYSSASFGRGGAVGFRFDAPGVYAYYSPTWGRSTSCGLVRVGQAAFDGDLPCESTSY